MASPDYSDVGNPVDSVLGGVFDDEDIVDTYIPPEIPPVVPVSAKTVTDAPPPSIDPDISRTLDVLKQVCDHFGILMSVPMVNQVKTLSVKETINESHLMWYARGIIMSNSNTVIPSITDAIADMSMETKQMQNTVSQLKRTASEVEKTATSLNRRMKESADSIKVEFESVLKQAARAAELDIQTRPVAMVSSSTTLASVIPQAVIDDEPIITERAIETPATIQPTEAPSKVLETKADKTKVIAAKRALMTKVGISAKIISAVSDDLVDSAVSNDLMIEIGRTALSVKVRSALKALLLDNISQGLEDS